MMVTVSGIGAPFSKIPYTFFFFRKKIERVRKTLERKWKKKREKKKKKKKTTKCCESKTGGGINGD